MPTGPATNTTPHPTGQRFRRRMRGPRPAAPPHAGPLGRRHQGRDLVRVFGTPYGVAWCVVG